VRRLQVRGLDAFDNEFDGLACYETEDCLFTDLYLHDIRRGISLDLAFNHNVISNAVLNANDLACSCAPAVQSFCNVPSTTAIITGVHGARGNADRARLGPAPKTSAPKTPSPTSSPSIAAGRLPGQHSTAPTTSSPATLRQSQGRLSLAQPDLVTVQ